ncbi:MAG: AmmeMemoRadiSam system protein A [Nitrospirota bacterium]|nr:AmmeMemoRadiSam system protein A [Nitrospirota bacterium]
MHPLVQLAKKTVEAYVKEGRFPDPPTDPVAEMLEKAGVFVSLKKHGQLRGCIGTFSPTMPSVAEEIIRNAVSAATRDPRFAPVSSNELADIEYSVDILSSPLPVKDVAMLDPKKYGVIVTSGGRRGLLLPDLEGVDTVDDQLAITRRKAGIGHSEPIEIEYFEVKRYH